MSMLESLCAELLLDIVDYLDHISILCLSRSSKQLSWSLRPSVFRTARIRELTLEQFTNVICNDTTLASLVQDLSILIDFSCSTSAYDIGLRSLLNLRGLTLVSDTTKQEPAFPIGAGFGLRWPQDDGHTGSVQESLAQIPQWLPCLERCALVAASGLKIRSDKKMRSLERQALIFLHPTLQRLDIDYMTHLGDSQDDTVDHIDKILLENFKTQPNPFRSPIFEVDPLYYRTDLKCLTLTHCDLHPVALIWILAFPRNLQTFSLRFRNPGEKTQFPELAKPGKSRHKQIIVEALMRQSHSLSTLELQGLCGDDCIELGSFRELRNLYIDVESLLGSGSLDSRAERGLPNILPPSLEVLSLTHMSVKLKTVAHFDYLYSAMTGQHEPPTNLKSVHIIFDHTSLSDPYGGRTHLTEVARAFRGIEGPIALAIQRFWDRLIELGVEVQRHLAPWESPVLFSSEGRKLNQIFHGPVKWPAVSPPELPRW